MKQSLELTREDWQAVAHEVDRENLLLKAAQRGLIRRVTELEMELATYQKEAEDAQGTTLPEAAKAKEVKAK